jgi:hypothetical protein
LDKITYLYYASKRKFQETSNEKTGYLQMISEAWKQFYPLSPTNPPHSLKEDYRLKMRTLLDPAALEQKVKLNNKDYSIWMVGRYILGDDFDFTKSPFVPLKYIFNYTGFSWSGMLETAAYNGIKEYLHNRDSNALQLSVNSIDFFADNGMAPIGILYPNWDASLGFSSVWIPNVIDMGQLGDGLSGIIKCYCFMKDSGVAIKANWYRAVKVSLDNIMKRFPDGDVLGRISGITGQASYREGILYKKPSMGGPNGINFLIWAYADFYRLTNDAKYLKYAEKMGDIALFVLHHYGIMSGMEADYFNVDKRMFHGELAAFNRLYYLTRKKKWLEAAKLAGNAFGAWEYCYNVNFSNFPASPNAYFDYRSIGGTPVDIKFSTNNTNFQQGATEFLNLWTYTGEKCWFERARAILHQGTQLSLTENKREWLNKNSQHFGPAITKIVNPSNKFDTHVLGGGTEDVMMSWLYKGIWTSRFAGIISMYMLTEGFDSDDLIRQYGSFCYDYKYKQGGALDMLDNFLFEEDKKNAELSIKAHNMLSKQETYKLKLLNNPYRKLLINGQAFSSKQASEGVDVHFGPKEYKIIRVKGFL